MADLIPQIEQVASEPQKVVTDGQEATEFPLPDLIAADKYLKGIVAETGGGPKSAWSRLRMARFIPPGTTGEGDTR